MSHEAPRRLPLWAGEILVSLALLMGGGLLPPLHAGVGAPLFVFCLALGLALLAPRGLRAAHLLLLPLPLLAAAAPPPARAALVWLALSLLVHLDESPRARLLARTAALVTLYALAFSLPLTWGFFDGLAALQSRLLSALAGQPLRLGPGALLHLPAFFLLRGAAEWAGGGGVRRLAWAAAGLLLQVAGLALALRIMKAGPLLLPAVLPAGSLLLFLVVDLAAGAPRPRPPVPDQGVWKHVLLAVSGLALAGLAWSLQPPPARLDGLEVGFRRAGIWSEEWPSPHDDSIPRLGGMQAVLRAWGARITILDDAALRAGPACRVLFVVQPDTLLDEALRASLGRWMEAGGVLVAVGEHTHVHGIGTGLGSLLQDYHIRLRDDCAIPSLHGWLWSHDLRFLQSAGTAGLWDSQDLGVSIGASLDVEVPAWPLVTGSLAFADQGDSTNERGRMGNTRPDPGERLGEVPLVAAEPVGRGLLVVLGDKSPLMSLNNPLVWPFYLNLTARLAERPGMPGHPVLPLLLMLLVALGLVPVLRGLSRRSETLVACALAAALWWPLRTPALPAPAGELNPDLLWIDQSHQPAWWHVPDHDWSRSGLVNACFASRVVPAALPRLDADVLAGGRTLLVDGPSRSYSRGERRLLRDWVEKGGRLVVAGDGRRRAALSGLLESFGMALGDAPLGAAPEGLDQLKRPLGFSFWEAWPVEDLAGGADTVASCWGYALALSRPVGSGTVTVVGDERIFSRWALEGVNRSGSWRSTASRFRHQAMPLARPAPSADKLRYLRSSQMRTLGARFQAVPHTPPGAAPGRAATPVLRPAVPPARKPLAAAPDPETQWRARWALGLLGLQVPATVAPAPPLLPVRPGPLPAQPGPAAREGL